MTTPHANPEDLDLYALGAWTARRSRRSMLISATARSASSSSPQRGSERR